MSAIEDRLRDAYQGAAATVRPGTLRSAPPAGSQPGHSRRRPSRRRHRLLAAVSAAAAVTAIAGTAVAVPRLLSGHSGGGATSGGPGRPARFFVASGNHSDLIIYNAATGTRVRDIRPPAHKSLGIAAATGNDRIFIVAQASTAACGTTHLLRLTLRADGTPASMSLLPAPGIAGSVTALASDADGRAIAYASETCTARGAESSGVVGVVHTDGRPARHWGWNPDPGQTVGSLSITADGKLIEYAPSPNKVISQNEGQTLPVRVIRLLPAGAAPGTAAARSRVLVRLQAVAPGTDWTSAVIAPGGETVYFCTEDDQAAARPPATLRAYDLAGGVTSVLRTFGSGRSMGCLLGVSAGHLLVLRDIASTPSSLRRYDLRTGKLTPVPVRDSIDEITSSVPW